MKKPADIFKSAGSQRHPFSMRSSQQGAAWDNTTLICDTAAKTNDLTNQCSVMLLYVMFLSRQFAVALKHYSSYLHPELVVLFSFAILVIDSIKNSIDCQICCGFNLPLQQFDPERDKNMFLSKTKRPAIPGCNWFSIILCLQLEIL